MIQKKTSTDKLVEAILTENVDEVRVLLAQRPGIINRKSVDGKIPLTAAAFQANIEILGVILDQPSLNVKGKDKNGYNALENAAFGLCTSIKEKTYSPERQARYDQTLRQLTGHGLKVKAAGK